MCIRDRSVVMSDNSHITNVTLKGNYTVDIGALAKKQGNSYSTTSIKNTNVHILNSHMEYINALRFFGDNSKIHNSTFEKCNLLNIVSNNFTMLSNSFINSTDDNYQGFIRGNDTKFVDNSVTNNSAGFLLWESDNITIKHNICHNVTGHCFRFVQVNNSVIKNNNFSNKESYHSLFFEDSNNNENDLRLKFGYQVLYNLFQLFDVRFQWKGLLSPYLIQFLSFI